jgi:Zn-dependent M28 family amino/carboxypeptidase
MRKTKRSLKIQLINKAALVRLKLLTLALLISAVWVWLALLWMPGQSYTEALPPLTTAQVELRDLLQQDVEKIAVEIGARNAGKYAKLNETKAFLETALTQAGYTVNLQTYKIENKPYYNLEVERVGTVKPNEVVIIGGHYDSAFTSSGANDNGTGVAATIELARLFANQSRQRTIRFVAFTNEEPPFFWTDEMGSLVYAKQIDVSKEKVVAMLSLETMGYFSEAIASQKYPFPIGLFYPDRGNFIGFVGDLNSGDLVRRVIGSFRHHAQFPSEGAILPSWLPGIGWSDQWSFWQQGYQAIMVTDTARYRYPYYHTEDDTPDKIDFDRLTRVVSGLAEVISDLAE